MHDNSLTKPFTKKDGRSFGLSVGLAFVALAGLLLWRDKETVALVMATIGGVLILGGLVLPAQLGPVYRGWMRFALLISKVTTPIFMGIVYFGLFLVTGLIRRGLGKNGLVHAERNGSLWIPREVRRGDLERQF